MRATLQRRTIWRSVALCVGITLAMPAVGLVGDAEAQPKKGNRGKKEKKPPEAPAPAPRPFVAERLCNQGGNCFENVQVRLPQSIAGELSDGVNGGGNITLQFKHGAMLGVTSYDDSGEKKTLYVWAWVKGGAHDFQFWLHRDFVVEFLSNGAWIQMRFSRQGGGNLAGSVLELAP